MLYYQNYIFKIGKHQKIALGNIPPTQKLIDY